MALSAWSRVRSISAHQARAATDLSRSQAKRKMTLAPIERYHRPIAGPIHAIVLAFPVALFVSALLADITYVNTAVIQWTNFASWLIAGAELFTGIALAWAILSYFLGRARHMKRRGLYYIVVLAVLFVAGMINAFHHARDGWHSVGAFGIVLSVVCSVLAILAVFIAHGSPRQQETRA
jgi:uncharacterized membrane protein